jgi:hypothetical protein
MIMEPQIARQQHDHRLDWYPLSDRSLFAA